MNPCEQIRPLLEAYALECLESGERAEVERHLPTCADCQRIAADYAETLATLPFAIAAASGAEPPPGLRSHILQAAAAPATTPRRLPLRLRSAIYYGQLPRWGRWSGRVVAFFTLLLGLLGLSLLMSIDQTRTLRTEVTKLIRQQAIVLEVIDSARTTRGVMRAAETSQNSGAYGKVFTRSDRPEVVIMAAGMPLLPGNPEYQVWLLEAGQPVLAGVLNLNDDGFGLLVYTSPHVGPTYERAWVTLKKEGAPRAEHPPVLLWDAAGADTPATAVAWRIAE